MGREIGIFHSKYVIEQGNYNFNGKLVLLINYEVLLVSRFTEVTVLENCIFYKHKIYLCSDVTIKNFKYLYNGQEFFNDDVVTRGVKGESVEMYFSLLFSNPNPERAIIEYLQNE